MNGRQEIDNLRELAKRVQGEEWFVEHAATKDGLSRIDDGLAHGMHPIYGEAHDIEFAAACVNYVLGSIVPLTREEIEQKEWVDSGIRERARKA